MLSSALMSDEPNPQQQAAELKHKIGVLKNFMNSIDAEIARHNKKSCASQSLLPATIVALAAGIVVYSLASHYGDNLPDTTVDYYNTTTTCGAVAQNITDALTPDWVNVCEFFLNLNLTVYNNTAINECDAVCESSYNNLYILASVGFGLLVCLAPSLACFLLLNRYCDPDTKFSAKTHLQNFSEAVNIAASAGFGSEDYPEDFGISALPEEPVGDILHRGRLMLADLNAELKDITKASILIRPTGTTQKNWCVDLAFFKSKHKAKPKPTAQVSLLEDVSLDEKSFVL